MNWLVKISLLSLFVFSSCFFESEKEENTEKWVAKSGSEGALNQVLFNFDDDDEIIGYKSTRTFKLESYSDTKIIISSEDSLCKGQISENYDGVDFNWERFEVDTLGYTLSNDSLYLNFWYYFKAHGQAGNGELEQTWLDRQYGDISEISISKNEMTVKFTGDYKCLSDRYVFEGSSAEKIDCNTVKVDVEGHEYVYNQVRNTKRWENKISYKGLECESFWENSYNVMSEAECIDYGKIFNDSSCDEVSLAIREATGDWKTLCIASTYNDGVCNPGCLNFDDRKDCEGYEF